MPNASYRVLERRLDEPGIPMDLWAERMLLGILILCPDALPEMPPALQDAWWEPDHRQLYAALLHLGEATTPSALARAFAPDRPIEQVKAAAIISQCIFEVPSTGYAYRTAYVNDVLQLADRRRRIDEGAKMVQDAWTDKPERGSTVKARVKDAPRMEGDTRRP